ncbi:MAG: CDP-diacylglycerol--serine O-phosphatidyltransferase [Bryobacteraceae bacterium]|jgi:CDP-diacylglycerol--serine O-phosphatidyltransferase
MDVRSLSKRWIAPEGRPKPRAAYALPTLFTAGNIFLGFLAIMRSIQGALLVGGGDTGPNAHFEIAATAIGWAVLLDGLDGLIARLTNTASEFGREMDSLADVISFGIAPAVLAYTWGVQSGVDSAAPAFQDVLRKIGYFIPFLFLACGAARLARFNIQKNPVPKNPGRPDRRYFVGLPIPAAAAMVASIVFALDGAPLVFWPLTLVWLALIALLSFLMVSTWRYRSLKDIQLLRPRAPYTMIIAVSVIVAWWMFTAPLVLAVMTTYIGSGIAVRLGGIVRRRLRRAPEPEREVG